MPVRLAADWRVELAIVEQRQNLVVEGFGAREIRDRKIDVIEPDHRDPLMRQIRHWQAFAITLRRKVSHLSSSESATNSSALWAWSSEPGPQTTAEIPAPWKWPASVPYATASTALAPRISPARATAGECASITRPG